MDSLRNILKTGKGERITFIDGTYAEVDNKTSDSLLTIYDALSDENKEKMKDMLSSTVEDFMKVLNFSAEHLE